MSFLVLSSVGDSSKHKQWLFSPSNSKREFTLALLDFSNNKNDYESDCDYYIQRKGYKFDQAYHFFQVYKDLIDKYDYIYLIDDDIDCSLDDINQLFHLASSKRTWVCQASLRPDSHCIHFPLFQNKTLGFDQKFVEIMCPVLSKEAFKRYMPLFKGIQFGFQLDLLWCLEAYYEKKPFGVFHQTSMGHTRPQFQSSLYDRNGYFQAFYESLPVTIKTLDVLKKYHTESDFVKLVEKMYPNMETEKDFTRVFRFCKFCAIYIKNQILFKLDIYE